MKGYICLSEGRSGSNWLGSMANKSGKLGHLTEWLGTEYHDKPVRKHTRDEFFEAVIKQASPKNDRFAIKIFPRHLHNVSVNIGFDFIRHCMEQHETRLVLLTRRDTFAQAVSFVRGVQTRQWTSRNEASEQPVYDFPALCRAYFYINRSYQYWDAYLGINRFDHDRFVYEDLLGDPTPYLENLTRHLDVEHNDGWKTDLKIQRDDLTKVWLERFREDVKTKNVVEFSGNFGSFQSFGVPVAIAVPKWPNLLKRITKSFR